MTLWVGSSYPKSPPLPPLLVSVSIGLMELQIMAFVVSVPIPIPIPMPRFTNGHFYYLIKDFISNWKCCGKEAAP